MAGFLRRWLGDAVCSGRIDKRACYALKPCLPLSSGNCRLFMLMCLPSGPTIGGRKFFWPFRRFPAIVDWIEFAMH